ncbi:MAG TPA: hypothetical protein DC047_05480 [Blastocatellia bacterium]|nr:hypothetical protein [Blastocatellia bacterium]
MPAVTRDLASQLVTKPTRSSARSAKLNLGLIFIYGTSAHTHTRPCSLELDSNSKELAQTMQTVTAKQDPILEKVKIFDQKSYLINPRG